MFSFYAFLLVSQKIILTTADLGRYLKSGQLFFQSHLIPHLNLFSYTYSNFPIIDHHWGAGLIFYPIYHLTGFAGLSIFSAFGIALAAFFSFWLASQLVSKNVAIAIISAILTIPLITYRCEVRPEQLSFFLLVLDIFLLTQFLRRRLSFRRLMFIYLPIQILWVNFHIFFAFGIGLAGLAFLADLVSDRRQIGQLIILIIGSIGASLINPFFFKGLIEPLTIFRNYGYMVVENQSIFFAIKRLPNLIFFQALFLAVLALLSFFYLIWRRRQPTELFIGMSAIFFSFLGLRYIRALPLMGLALLPFLSLSLNLIGHRIAKEAWQLVAAVLISLVFWLAVLPTPYSPWYRGLFGWGLAPQAEAAGQFFRQSHLHGPIFNNYDIGGYLIWYLYPKERVFVDNRPEAYPASFFQKIYIPAQESEPKWRWLNKLYHFNVIFFYRHDNTPWAQPFLLRRVRDPNWVPIYVDAYSLILVRNSPTNKKIIARYRLPRKIFRSGR